MARGLLVLSILALLTDVELLKRPGSEDDYSEDPGMDQMLPRPLDWAQNILHQERPRFSEATDYKRSLLKQMFRNNFLNLNEKYQAYLRANSSDYESFFVLLHSYVSVLSFTLTSCSSPIDFKIYYKVQEGKYTAATLGMLLVESNSSTHASVTYNVDGADKGLYTIMVRPYNNSRIELYVRQLANDHLWTPLTIHKHRRGKKVTVRWSESIIDPQIMQYCIELDQSSLCKPISNRYEDNTPEIYELQQLPNKRDVSYRRDNETRMNNIKCVGKRTSHTYYNLEQGRDYYINVFAYNPKTNMTYPYGSTYLKYDRRHKPIGLRDGQAQVVNLRKNDGKVTLRYKVLDRFRPGPLEWFILPCGGIVHVEVRIRRKVIIARHQVSSFRHLTIRDPLARQRYVVHITALDRDELNKISAVEVLATMNSKALDTFPDLPDNTKVREYTSLRECNSVFIGWYPGPTTANMVRYCIKATEVPRRYFWNVTAFETKPNQCGLDGRLKKPSKEYSTMECLYVTPHKASFRKELKQKVSNLSPGRDYMIQVIMKKTRSRSLSYDLLRVSTVPTCVD